MTIAQAQPRRPGSPRMAPEAAVPAEPFIYTVAANLHRVMHLSRSQQLFLWRRILDLYAQENQTVHGFMRELCHEPFVESLLENEIFWGLAGPVSHDYYGRATTCLAAVYAVAALLAAREDHLPLTPEEQSLLASQSS